MMVDKFKNAKIFLHAHKFFTIFHCGIRYRIYLIRRGGLLFIKINLQTRLLIVTRLVNEA